MKLARLGHPSSEVLALSLLTAGEQAHAFSAFMPSAFTASNWVLNGSWGEVAEKVAMWRRGYRPAVLFGLGLAAAVSWIAKSPLPLIFAAVSGVGMVCMYENVLPKEFRVPAKEWPEVLLLGKISIPEASARDVTGVRRLQPAMGL